MKKALYYGAVVIALFIVVDNASGSAKVGSSLFGGTGQLVSVLQGRNTKGINS